MLNNFQIITERCLSRESVRRRAAPAPAAFPKMAWKAFRPYNFT